MSKVKLSSTYFNSDAFSPPRHDGSCTLFVRRANTQCVPLHHNVVAAASDAIITCTWSVVGRFVLRAERCGLPDAADAAAAADGSLSCAFGCGEHIQPDRNICHLICYVWHGKDDGDNR